MDIRSYNREAWNRQVEGGNPWTRPVSPEVIAEARQGRWKIVLTPLKPVPAAWYPPISGADVLCLASGGGQQGPVLSAAGARVTVLDNSPRQLGRDREVAEREGLDIRTVEGDMRDLSPFAGGSFDLIINPVSNPFIPDLAPMWRECFRVLRPGGVLVTGFANPDGYIFEIDKAEQGIFEVVNRLPYSDVGSMTPEALEKFLASGLPLEWSHTMDEQLGGILEAGFLVSGFYEDRDPDKPLSAYMPIYYAVRAVKPGA